MATSRQALSLWRGRAGGIVYSALKGKQIMRSAPSQVSNPKSDAQIMQRMKLAPAAHFYRTLEGMVYNGFASHTFQGRKYGNDNRLRFMQLAMLNNQGPYVQKDTLKFIPFDYQISEGSLPSMTPRVHVVDNGTLPTGATLIEGGTLTFTADNINAWADFLGVNVGDQISFLGFFHIGNENYQAEAARVRVAVGESINLADYSVAIYSATAGTVASQPYGSALFLFDEAAGAVVVSRQQENDTFLRSTEFVVISNDIREKYYSPAAIDAAVRSYGEGNNINSQGSDYYNDLGDRAFDGTIYLSALNYTENGAVKSGSFFWAKDAAGRSVLFTEDGTLGGNLITINENGTAAVESTIASDELVNVRNFNLVQVWPLASDTGAAYFEQYQSSMKAVRPIVGGVYDDEEGVVNPT